jgi:hypothetical protein
MVRTAVATLEPPHPERVYWLRRFLAALNRMRSIR